MLKFLVFSVAVVLSNISFFLIYANATIKRMVWEILKTTYAHYRPKKLWLNCWWKQRDRSWIACWHLYVNKICISDWTLDFQKNEKIFLCYKILWLPPLLFHRYLYLFFWFYLIFCWLVWSFVVWASTGHLNLINIYVKSVFFQHFNNFFLRSSIFILSLLYISNGFLFFFFTIHSFALIFHSLLLFFFLSPRFFSIFITNLKCLRNKRYCHFILADISQKKVKQKSAKSRKYGESATACK